MMPIPDIGVPPPDDTLGMIIVGFGMLAFLIFSAYASHLEGQNERASRSNGQRASSERDDQGGEFHTYAYHGAGGNTPLVSREEDHIYLGVPTGPPAFNVFENSIYRGASPVGRPVVTLSGGGIYRGWAVGTPVGVIEDNHVYLGRAAAGPPAANCPDGDRMLLAAAIAALLDR